MRINITMSNVHVISTERNTYVDIIRGIAMLLVILGHTMTGCTQGAENSFLYNVIWSLQMPLFFLVSGYVTRYSRKVENADDLRKFVKRRTISYLFPWLIWTFFVRGLIFMNSNFLNIKYLVFHMDAGYWFLTTIWFICIIWGISNYFAEKFFKILFINKNLLIFIIYCIGIGILIVIGYIWGMSFLGIRLTLYYMPFYFVGYIYGQFQDRIQSSKRTLEFTEIIIAVCFIFWQSVLVRYNLYNLKDSIFNIVLRAMASITGCIAITGLLKNVFNKQNYLCIKKIMWGVQEIGYHSIEIYVTHYLFLSILHVDQTLKVTSIRGASLWIINYAITIILTTIIVQILNMNKILRFVLYGKCV